MLLITVMVLRVKQSGTQTITDLSGIRCLSSNRVLVKNFLNPKNSGKRPRKKRFSIWKPRGAERVECLLILNIYTFLKVHPIKRIDIKPSL